MTQQMCNTIASNVLEHARRAPSSVAIITSKEIVDYRHLWKSVLLAAGILREHGVQKGDRVVLSATSSKPSFIYGYLGAHLLGAIAVPIDPQTPDARLKYIIEQTEPRVMFKAGKPLGLEVRECAIEELDDNSYTPTPLAELPQTSSDDVADILFTTGTTGEPKGVVLTQWNILSAARNINAFIGNSATDREVVPLPLSHSFGLGRLRCNLLTGGGIILTDGFTFPSNILLAIEKWKATGFSSVPSGIEILLRTLKDRIGRYANQLRYMEIGSAPMANAVKKRLMYLLPDTRICMHYGLTEASRATFIEFHASRKKLDSIGTASPNVDIKIADGENRAVRKNQPGRILVKGAMVMREYWRDSDRTQRVLQSGWLDTGDIGCQDEDGYIFLAGREKEMINIGGRKVSPVEIEKLLVAHKAVDNCACIAIPDPRGIAGEVVKAFLVAKLRRRPVPREFELVEFLRGKIEPYKIPIEFEWVEEIPTTSSGKVQRLRLREQQHKSATSE